MSWLTVLFDVTDIAIGVNNAYKIGQLKQQKQTAEALQALYQAMMDYVFRASQIYDDIMYHKSKRPIAVAATMFYLELELEKSGITPDLFNNITDKEYVASTKRKIQHTRELLLEHFTPEQRELAAVTGDALHDIEDIVFVVGHYEDAITLADLKSRKEGHNQLKKSMNYNEWKMEEVALSQQIKTLEKEINIKSWVSIYEKHGQKSLPDFLQQRDQMAELIMKVFTDEKLIPRLIFALPSSEEEQINQEPSSSDIIATNPQSVTKTTAPQQTVSKGDGRIACPHCGYRNTIHRKTCKKCKELLDK